VVTSSQAGLLPSNTTIATIDWGHSSVVLNKPMTIASTGPATYQFTISGPGGVSLTLGGPPGSGGGGGAAAPAAPPILPPTFNQLFVTRAYQALAGQAVDPSTLAVWAGVLDQGFSPVAVVRQLVGLPAVRMNLIDGLFRIVLHRHARPKELADDLRFLDQGGTLLKLMARLFASAEYFRVRGGGTAAGFLAALARDLLHQQTLPAPFSGVDPAGLQNDGGRLALVNQVLKSAAARRTEAQNLFRLVNLPVIAPELRDAAKLLGQGVSAEDVLALFVAALI
jgi:hypothetical protein